MSTITDTRDRIDIKRTVEVEFEEHERPIVTIRERECQVHSAYLIYTYSTAQKLWALPYMFSVQAAGRVASGGWGKPTARNIFGDHPIVREHLPATTFDIEEIV